MGRLMQDLSWGAKGLLRSPGFTAFAALTLALGVGATAAVFTVLDRVVLRPFPYEGGERLVQVGPMTLPLRRRGDQPSRPTSMSICGCVRVSWSLTKRIGVSPPPNPDAFVVGCDSGYDHAIAKGHDVDLLVGDLDSISPSGLESALASDIEIERHPPHKDATDFELSVDACARRGITDVAIFGGEGGRIDHLLAIATALTSEKWHLLSLTWHTAHGVTMPLTGPAERTVTVTRGATVSLTAVTDCDGITTTGLAWTLDGEMLARGSSRGISNVAQSESVTVTIDSGSLLITASTDHPQHDIEG